VDSFASKFQLVTAYIHSPIFVLTGQSGTGVDDPFVIHYMCKTYKTKKSLQEANTFPISIDVIEYLKNAADLQGTEEISPAKQPAAIFAALKALVRILPFLLFLLGHFFSF